MKKEIQIRIFARISLLFFLCAILFSIGYLFLGNKETKNKINIDTNSLATTTPTPAVRVESFTYTIDPIDITVEYPQFVHTASSTVELALNEKIKTEAKKIYEESLKDLQDASRDFVGKVEIIPETVQSTTSTSTISASSTPKTKVTYDRSVTFERKVLKDKTYIRADTHTASIAYEQYTDSGGAHGTFSYDSKTVDIETGVDLFLRDILQGDYEKILIADIEQQIHNTTETCIRCEGLISGLDDIQMFIPKTFILSDTGITFLYSAYDLGAYALTSSGQEITVSKEKLLQNISRPW